jgi:hypothetical protein
MRHDKQLIVTDLRGGVNETDPPMAQGASDKFMQSARNIEFFAGGLCRKRNGCAEPAGLTYSATAGKIASLFRHTVGTDEQSTELWYFTDGGGIGRMPIASLTAANVTGGDTPVTSAVQYATAASLGGKLYLAFKNGVDRLHVWDGTSLRRAGLAATSAAPTTANTAGAVTDTRRYRVTYVKKTSTVYDLRSEPSNETGAIALAGQRCTITKNSNPGESETHWELWASSTATNYGTWYKIGEAAIATTTIEDNFTDLSSYSGEVAEYRGERALFMSGKYLIADENRLLMAGSYDTPSAYASRVFFSAVLGTTDIGDDERTPNSVGAEQKFYVDVGRGIDGGITGMAGPLYDSIYVFKTSSIWKLVKTGVVANPYRVVNVHKNVGAINHKSIILGEDETGQPCLYFLSRRGPYRIGPRGLEYLGADIETTFATVNLDADLMVAHGVYYHRKHQVWWWLATGSSDSPDTLIVYDTQQGKASDIGVRGGWVVHSGKLANTAYCSTMYSLTLGGSTASYDLRPYFGRHDANNKLILADKDATFSDHDAAGYVSYFRTRAYALGILDKQVRVTGMAVVAKPNSASSPCLWVRAERNWNMNWAEYHVSIPASDLARVLVSQPEPMTVRQGPPGSDLVSLYVYDNADQAVGWQLDALVADYAPDGER